MEANSYNEKRNVYNLSVANNHSFMVSNAKVVVKNCTPHQQYMQVLHKQWKFNHSGDGHLKEWDLIEALERRIPFIIAQSSALIGAGEIDILTSNGKAIEVKQGETIPALKAKLKNKSILTHYPPTKMAAFNFHEPKNKIHQYNNQYLSSGLYEEGFRATNNVTKMLIYYIIYHEDIKFSPTMDDIPKRNGKCSLC